MQTCRSHHHEDQRPIQKQIDKLNKNQNQTNMITLETYRCLSAELERLVNYCTVKGRNHSISRSYTRCLNQETDDPVSMMLNIEGFTQALEGYLMIAAKNGTKVPPFPEEYQKDIEFWIQSIDLIDNPEESDLQLELEVLRFVLGQISNQQPVTNMSEDLQERILSTEKRDSYCQEQVKNGQSNILALVNIAHSISDKTQAQADQAFDAKKEVKADKTLIFNLEEDIDALNRLKLLPQSTDDSHQHTEESSPQTSRKPEKTCKEVPPEDPVEPVQGTEAAAELEPVVSGKRIWSLPLPIILPSFSFEVFLSVLVALQVLAFTLSWPLEANKYLAFLMITMVVCLLILRQIYLFILDAFEFSCSVVRSFKQPIPQSKKLELEFGSTQGSLQ